MFFANLLLKNKILTFVRFLGADDQGEEENFFIDIWQFKMHGQKSINEEKKGEKQASLILRQYFKLI